MIRLILLIGFISLFSSPVLTLTKNEERRLGDLINVIDASDPSNLNENMKNVADLLRLSKAGIANHYCCAIESQVTYENRTRVSSYNVTQTISVIVGYEPCGENIPNPFTKPTSTTSRKPTLIEQLFGTTTRKYTLPTNIPTCESKPIIETSEHTVVQYKIEVYQVTFLNGACPAEHLKCCENYTMINGQCIETALIPSLQNLINLGLIG